MFIFLRLLLAHFIGDFPLQFNKIYELKHRGVVGGLPHALLILSSLVILSWPYLTLPSLWVFLVAIGTLHLFQDSIKVGFGKIKYSFWLYLLDQAFHIGMIATVFLTDLKAVRPPAETGSLWVSLYNNDLFVIYLIALIVATYNGLYLIRSYRITFFRRAGVYTEFEKWYGMLERGVVVTVFLFDGCFLLLLPFIFTLRPLVYYSFKKKIAVRKRFISFQEISFSWIIAVTTGAVLYFLSRAYLLRH